MRVALYLRCSTQEQSVDLQLDTLRRYATARRLEVVAEYIDHGVSGAKDRRPALDEMMAKAKVRSFDAVAVVKLDRLARSTRHLTQIAAELEALGVDLIVTDQGIDTSTPAGRLLFNVLAAIGEFELDLIRERTRAGVEAARKRGVRFGRPRLLNDQQRARIHRLRASGSSFRGIAKKLGVSKSLVAKELSTKSLSTGGESAR